MDVGVTWLLVPNFLTRFNCEFVHICWKILYGFDWELILKG